MKQNDLTYRSDLSLEEVSYCRYPRIDGAIEDYPDTILQQVSDPRSTPIHDAIVTLRQAFGFPTRGPRGQFADS
jgi:hypothetical protein